MSQLIEIAKEQLGSYYSKLKSCSARERAEMLYAVIGIKRRYKELEKYERPLYLDVKQFITSHLDSFHTEDYGYDIPNNEKVIEAINSLPLNEQLAMCRYADKLYDGYSYDTSFLDKRINKLRMCLAWKEHRYLSFLLRLSAHNIWSLLASYLLFLIIVYLILLPAPFEWMGVLQIDLYDFGLSPFKNQVMNTLALITGGEFAPRIIPYGLRGMLLIILGNITFYLLIGNFVVKKLMDFFSFE